MGSTPSIRLRLRVSPGAKHSRVTGRHGDGWKVRVNAPAEKGKANEEVMRLLREALHVGRENVTIVRGKSSRDKLVEVSGLAVYEVDQRLAQAARERS